MAILTIQGQEWGMAATPPTIRSIPEFWRHTRPGGIRCSGGRDETAFALSIPSVPYQGLKKILTCRPVSLIYKISTFSNFRIKTLSLFPDQLDLHRHKTNSLLGLDHKKRYILRQILILEFWIKLISFDFFPSKWEIELTRKNGLPDEFILLRNF